MGHGKVRHGFHPPGSRGSPHDCHGLHLQKIALKQRWHWFFLGKSKPETIDFPMKIIGLSCKLSQENPSIDITMVWF
jgi:hypothetical protein